MATYKICKNCNKVTEVIKKKEYIGKDEILTYKCSKCGYEERTTINNTHYGNDALNKQ